jgi:hypothetical protein
MAFNLNNVFTSVSKHKLNLAKIMLGVFDVIFMKRVSYSNKKHLTWLIMDIHLILMF